jgi:parallel beta-helix repeat protein
MITENNITNNENGISPYYSSNNKIFHNSFANNKNQVNPQTSLNIWDNGYPSGGNHWSNYNGTDSDHDGIGDTPYIIDADNQDNYPIMNPRVHKVGDVNFDGKVDVKDVYAVSRAYGTTLKGPNPSGRYYTPVCDLNNDNKIDVRDLYIVAQRYGT